MERSVANLPKQTEFILQNKADSLLLLLRAVFEMFRWKNINGSLGWQDAPVSAFATKFFLRIFLFAVVSDISLVIFNLSQGERSLRALWKSIAPRFAIAMAVLASVMLSMLIVSWAAYMHFAPPGSGVVYSLQGRYFHFHLLIVIGAIFSVFSPVRTNQSIILPSSTFQRRGSNFIFGMIAVVYCLAFSLVLLGRYW